MSRRVERALRGTVTAAVLVTALASSALACETGTAMRRDVGDFRAELLYDAYDIEPGQTVQFHVDLYNVRSRSYGPGNPVPYTTAHVELTDGGRTIAETDISRENFGETGTTWTMPDRSADYALRVRFSNGDEEMATSDFPVRVGHGSFWRNLLTLGRARASLFSGLDVETN